MLQLNEPATVFRAALPFEGTWIGGLRSHPIDRLVNEFIDAGRVRASHAVS